MKKLLLFLTLIALLITTTVVFGHSPKSVYIEWVNSGEISANFLPTKSGLVQAWSYDHPRLGDSHWVVKPVDKFNNSTCDDGVIHSSYTWTPGPLFTKVKPAYKTLFMEVFPDLNRVYVLCIYSM